MAALCMFYIKHKVVTFPNVLQPESCFKQNVSALLFTQCFSKQCSITVQQSIKEEGTGHFFCLLNL